jgi:hypothetical protein
MMQQDNMILAWLSPPTSDVRCVQFYNCIHVSHVLNFVVDITMPSYIHYILPH